MTFTLQNNSYPSDVNMMEEKKLVLVAFMGFSASLFAYQFFGIMLDILGDAPKETRLDEWFED
jgi:hypothetical protein